MTKELSKKQKLKFNTTRLMYALSMLQLEPEQRRDMTTAEVRASYPKETYHIDNRGSVTLGLCYKKLRNLVKKNPLISPQQVAKMFKLTLIDSDA